MTPQEHFDHLPETFWAWLAGFVDGDGTIVFEHVKATPNFRVKLSVAQKPREPLDYIFEKLGTGSVFLSKTNDVHHIRFGSAVSREIISRIRPYLVHPEKQRRAAIAADWRSIGIGERSNSPEQQAEFSEVVAAYRSGLSSFQVAEQFGLHHKQVLRWIERDGAGRTEAEVARLRGLRMRGKPKRGKHEEVRAKVRRLDAIGVPRAMIARAVGFKRQYIEYWLKDRP